MKFSHLHILRSGEDWDDFLPALMNFSTSHQSSSSEPKDVTPPELAALRGPFANAVSSLFGAGNLSGVPNYNPATDAVPAAPLASGEQMGLNKLTTQMLDPTVGKYLNDVIGGNYLPGQSGANPYLNSTIEAAQRPTWQGLYDTLSRALPGRFTQAGQFTNPQGSSAFDRAAAVAGRSAEQTAGDIASNISYGAYNQERTNQQQAVQLSQQEVQSTISGLQAQALPRLIQQYGIDQGLQLFQTRVDTLIKALAAATGAPLVSVGNSQQSSGSSFGVSNPFSFNYNF